MQMLRRLSENLTKFHIDQEWNRLMTISTSPLPVQEPVATGFKGRHGYYPCDKETFKDLRRVHKAFWQNVPKQAASERWNAKQPQNRQGECPEYNPTYHVDKVYVPGNQSPDTFPRWCRNTEGHPIRQMYLSAKTPSEDPVSSFTKEQLETIERWVADMNKWAESH